MDRTTYIYESPDGGDTIYRRPFGSDPMSRELHHVSEKKKALMEDLRETKFWSEVHRTALKDPELARMLDQVRTYFTLKHKNTPPKDR